MGDGNERLFHCLNEFEATGIIIINEFMVTGMLKCLFHSMISFFLHSLKSSVAFKFYGRVISWFAG